MQAVILANGKFPKNNKLINIIKEANYLAVCDGAILNIDKLDIKPNIIIGDLDSIPNSLKLKYKNEIIHIAEQNSNDLSKAFYHCLSLGFNDFIILGATGKREDHAIANISLLSIYAKKCNCVIMQSDYGEFRVYYPPCKIKSYKGQQISIFTLNPYAKLTSYGLKYPLNSLTLNIWANGTLNEANGEEFIIESNINIEIIIYKKY